MDREVNDLTARKRSRSWFGRIYCDRDNNEFLITHDDLGEFVTLMDINGKERIMTVLMIRSSCSGDSWNRAYWVTKDIGETMEQKKKDMPQAWLAVLHALIPN